jgi:hypothetical protein
VARATIAASRATRINFISVMLPQGGAPNLTMQTIVGKEPFQLQRSAQWPFGLQLSNIALSFSHAFAAVLYPWIMYDLTRSVGCTALIAFVNAGVLVIGMVFGGRRCRSVRCWSVFL